MEQLNAKLEANDSNIFRTALTYCIYIIILPISSFFLSKWTLFDSWYGSDSVAGNIWSAIVAVLVLHICLFVYVFKAFATDKPIKQD